MNGSELTTLATSSKGWVDILLALLNWPFLLFVGTGIFIWIFRDNVSALLKRGDIQISWGENRHIKLTEISDGIDEELDPLKEEILFLKTQLADLEAKLSTRDGDASSQSIQAKVALTPEEREDAKRRLLIELKNGKYRWRSIETLSKKVALSESDTIEILRASTSEAVLSTGKSGRQIARHTSR